MNKILYAVAFAAGIGTGVLISRSYFKQKYEAIADEEIDSVKEAYGVFKKEATDILNQVDEMKEEYERRSVAYSPRTEMVVDDHPRDDIPDYPYEITEEDYAETELSYDKKVLQYYIDDGILFDQDENEVVMGQATLIGEDGFEKVKNADDTFALYFRDDTYGADYEVVRVSGSFYEDK